MSKMPIQALVVSGNIFNSVAEGYQERGISGVTGALQAVIVFSNKYAAGDNKSINKKSLEINGPSSLGTVSCPALYLALLYPTVKNQSFFWVLFPENAFSYRKKPTKAVISSISRDDFGCNLTFFTLTLI